MLKPDVFHPMYWLFSHPVIFDFQWIIAQKVNIFLLNVIQPKSLFAYFKFKKDLESCFAWRIWIFCFETPYYLFSDVKLYGCLYQEMFNFHRLNTQWEPISTDLDMVLYFHMYWEQENFMKNFLYFLCILSMAEKKGNSQPRIYHVYHINISDTVTAFKISHSSYFLVTTSQ